MGNAQDNASLLARQRADQEAQFGMAQFKRQGDIADQRAEMGFKWDMAGRQDEALDERLQANIQAQNARAEAAIQAANDRAAMTQQELGDRAVAQDYRQWAGKIGDEMRFMGERGLLWNEKAVTDAFNAAERALGSPNLTPAEKTSAMIAQQQKIQAALAAARPNPDGPPKDLPQQFEGETVTKELNGQVIVYSRDRSGAWREVSKVLPEKQEEYTKFVDSMLGKEKKGSDGESAGQYTAEDIHKMWNERQKALAMMHGAPPNSVAPVAGPASSTPRLQFQGPPPPPPPPQSSAVPQQAAPPVAPPVVAPPPQEPPPAVQQPQVRAPELDRQARYNYLNDLVKSVASFRKPSQFAQDQLSAELKHLESDDLRILAKNYAKAPPAVKQILAAELGSRPPEGMDFPYGNRNLRPLRVFDPDQPAQGPEDKGVMPGEKFIDPETGNVYLVMPDFTFKLVPQEILAAG
jgi:hypothetical protein